MATLALLAFRPGGGSPAEWRRLFFRAGIGEDDEGGRSKTLPRSVANAPTIGLPWWGAMSSRSEAVEKRPLVVPVEKRPPPRLPPRAPLRRPFMRTNWYLRRRGTKRGWARGWGRDRARADMMASFSSSESMGPSALSGSSTGALASMAASVLGGKIEVSLVRMG